MKLLLWSPGFTSFQGGIGAFSRELAWGLRDFGHEVRLIGKVDTPGVWQALPLWGAGAFPRRVQSPYFAAGAFTACAWYRPDYLVSTHVNFGPVAHWVKRAVGTPFTLVAHGIDVDERLSSARRAGLRAADQILAVSSWTRQRVLNLGGIDPGRVTVLPDMVDEDRFTVAARPDELVRRYDLQADERVVLTVARLEPSEGYKGYDRIVQALPTIQRACGRVRFLVVGEGEDRARLEALAGDLGVLPAVTFAGFVPDPELADHYRVADVFAMPSTGEGFGIVFLEAMACGTPVLAGNHDGSVDALDGGRLGQLVDPTDVTAIANGIIGLFKQQGPTWWFDRQALHKAVIQGFGRAAFRQRLRAVLPF